MPISGANPTPRTTAVYASDPALPRRPQDSLPSRLLSFGRTRLALASSYRLLLSHPGWAEAVACLRLPQNVACRFPALRSSGVGSQHYESLQRPVGQPQSWSEQRDPLLEPIESGPGKVAACPAAATEHLAPVTLDDPVHPLQRADVAGDTIIGVVPAEGEIERVDLFLDRPVSCLPHLIAQ